MAEPNQEPSMEEILASIKRVIAEDGRTHLREVRKGAPAADDVLELKNPVGSEDGLMSDKTAEASRARFTELAQARERAGPTAETALETMIREMLRPMLKEWLDQRLPEMVDELVSREIARITGKGG